MGSRGPVARQESIDVEVKPIPKAPPAPEGLLPATLERWEVLWQSDLSKVLAVTDLPALHRLFTYLDDWQRSRAVFVTLDPSEWTVESRRGLAKPHPVIENMHKLEADIARLETQLGLTPMARARLGVTLASAELTWRQLQGGDDDDTGGAGTPGRLELPE